MRHLKHKTQNSSKLKLFSSYPRLNDLFEPRNPSSMIFLFRYLPLPSFKIHEKERRKKLRVGSKKKMNSIHPSRNKRTSNYSKLGAIRQASKKKSILLFSYSSSSRASTSSISFYILVFFVCCCLRWMNGRCILQDLNYTFKVIVVCVLNCKIPSI